MSQNQKASGRNRRAGRVWLLAALLLIGTGITYRVLAARLQTLLASPINLPVPLKEFPQQIGAWQGEDVSIRQVTREYMERYYADDYINRRYVNRRAQEQADLYIVYCASRPAGILGHRPRICYPAHGLIHDGTVKIQVPISSDEEISCLLHRFHQPGLGGQETVVLSFYIVNGVITTNEDKFSSFWGRRPNLNGDPARFVAQVQISGATQHAVLLAAQEWIKPVLGFFPSLGE